MTFGLPEGRVLKGSTGSTGLSWEEPRLLRGHDGSPRGESMCWIPSSKHLHKRSAGRRIHEE